MKVKVGVNKREGFTNNYAMAFENGLTLINDMPLVFSTKNDREEIKKRFYEVVDAMLMGKIEMDNEP